MSLPRYAPFLGLLFVGTLSGAMIVPYMGFFIVQGLGRAPWAISLYAGTVAILVVTLNRRFARLLDAGADPFPLVGVAAVGSLLAAGALAISPAFWTVLTIGIPGFAAGASALSTMFSLGTAVAARSGIKGTTFNAYMRMTTSTAWMIGPAVSFVLADRLGPAAVFDVVVAVAAAWCALWWTVTPRGAMRDPGTATPLAFASGAARNPALLLAGTFVACLAGAHFLTFTALPLFFVQEVGLPGYAPGNAFTVKTAVEIAAIASTPLLIARLGMRPALIGTAILAVGAILFLASVETYGQMLVGAALEGLYYGLFSTLAIGYVQSLAPDRPAQATAVYWNATMTTSVLAGPAAGLIAQGSDFRTVIFVGAGVAAVAVVVLAAGAVADRRAQAG